MNLLKLIFNLILKYANKYKPVKYNTIYSNKYYLKYIYDALETVVSYKSLMGL